MAYQQRRKLLEFSLLCICIAQKRKGQESSFAELLASKKAEEADGQTDRKKAESALKILGYIRNAGLGL